MSMSSRPRHAVRSHARSACFPSFCVTVQAGTTRPPGGMHGSHRHVSVGVMAWFDGIVESRRNVPGLPREAEMVGLPPVGAAATPKHYGRARPILGNVSLRHLHSAYLDA